MVVKAALVIVALCLAHVAHADFYKEGGNVQNLNSQNFEEEVRRSLHMRQLELLPNLIYMKFFALSSVRIAVLC